MSLHLTSSACHDERFSLIFTYLPFNFNLTFSVFFHSSVLMHPDLHTDLDNLDSVENNLRHSAKGSLDTYDVIESLTLSEDIRVKHAHDGTGEPVKSSASTHIVKEQFVPSENRDIESFNADNEFNRATDEENIDFSIPGLPNSTGKRSPGVNVRNLIQKIENHPQRQALQSDLNNIDNSILTAKNHKT